MAKAKIIASMPILYTPGPPGGRGSLGPVAGYGFETERLYEALDQLVIANGGEAVAVTLEIKPLRDMRTLQQNALMWAMLDRIAKEQGITPWAAYLDILSDYGCEVEYMTCPVRALPRLRAAYRIVDIVELLDGGRCIIRCGIGSSGFNRAEMAELLERIFDRATALGIDDAKTVDEYRQWREAQFEDGDGNG